jgi:hypothetical protein
VHEYYNIFAVPSSEIPLPYTMSHA